MGKLHHGSQYGDTAEAGRERGTGSTAPYRKLLTEAVRLAGEHRALATQNPRGDRVVRRRTADLDMLVLSFSATTRYLALVQAQRMSARQTWSSRPTAPRVLTYREAKAGEQLSMAEPERRPAVRWPARADLIRLVAGGGAGRFPARSRPQGNRSQQ